MRFRVTGPKGRLVVRSITPERLRRIRAALVKRFGRITVTALRPKPNYRQRIVDWCRWSIAHEPQIHYRQSRPIPLRRGKTKQLPLYTDCSGHATIAYYQAGVPDPNGNHYDGSGYTGTLLQHGRRVAVRDAKPGDLVVFGPPPGHHVCVVLSAGSDPLLCSHGQERGPLAIRLSEERVFQPRPVVCINYID